MTPEERAEAIQTLIELHEQAMDEVAVIVVTGRRVRIRSARNMSRNRD